MRRNRQSTTLVWWYGIPTLVRLGHNDMTCIINSFTYQIFNTMDKTKAMLGERTKLRNKILAAAKNNESRANYNTLILYCQEYLDMTNDLVMMGRRVGISSELLKVSYWKERYKEFNERNPNIVMGSDDKTYRWVVKVDDLPLYQMRGSEREFRKVFDGIKSVMTYMNPMTPVTYVKLVK